MIWRTLAYHQCGLSSIPKPEAISGIWLAVGSSVSESVFSAGPVSKFSFLHMKGYFH